MARYTGPSCKLCRREGKKLFLKGDRCLSDKCAVSRRATVPGQHGAGRKTVKEYGMQLREKQTARRYYGVQEKQFKKYYVKADKKSGIAGENLLSILESRYDNAVYRMGLASSRSSEKFKELMEDMANVTAPKWLDLNKDAASAKVVAMPARDDVDFDFNEQLIIELYSK